MADEKRYPVSDEMATRLYNDYLYHPATPDQTTRYDTLRNMAKALARTIVQFTPPGREQSAALTSLETAIFQANAGIAREP